MILLIELFNTYVQYHLFSLLCFDVSFFCKSIDGKNFFYEMKVNNIFIHLIVKKKSSDGM